MSQSSLLSSCAPPPNDSKLEAWVVRVRDRLRSISKSVSHLEAERQSLLSMLWDAGLRDFAVEGHIREDQLVDGVPESHVTTASSSSSHRVLEQSAGSVIDLVSDEEPNVGIPVEAPAYARKSPEPLGSIPQFALPEPADECPATPVMASQIEPDENTDVCNIDPRELSFELPKPSSPQEVLKPRVYKPEEWQLVDWSKLSPSELKKWLLEFGLKPSGGRSQMVSQLKVILEYVCGGTSSISALPKMFSKQDLFAEFSALIRDHDVLYEKIILFESVELADVLEFLLSRRREEWPNVTQWTVREFLESIGAQFSNTAGNASANGRIRVLPSEAREENPNRKKVRRRLRQSVSCP